jgi:hypothetical protein
MNSTIGVLFVVAFFVFVFLKLRYEHGRSLPTEGQFLPVSGIITEDNPEAENESLLSEIWKATSGEDLRAIVDEWDLDGEENAVFLKKALELEDLLTEDDWESIFQAAEEGSELETIADQRYT